jgi:uncharacterized protein (DUF362 family)
MHKSIGLTQAAPPDPSRRRFLRGAAGALAGLLINGCGAEGFLAPSPPRTRVAIAQAQGYDREAVRRQVETLLDSLGGLDDIVGLGDRVGIKVNLTGGLHFAPPAGYSATESYLTHPAVVRALGELLLDAGARELFIVEAVYDDASYPTFGYASLADDLNASLIDLNKAAPYSGFANVSVGTQAMVYGEFKLHPILQEIDTFVSVGKMKCHYECGVTHALKNLVGLVPVEHYRLSEDHWWRSALHGEGQQTKARLPRVVVDLNLARPIDLALIDGVMTAEGGEAPRGTFNPVQPGILLAGKDPVATDAVATAAMGFDPEEDYPSEPFLRCENYLNLASAAGLGTNNLADISIVGSSLEAVTYPFAPSRSM